MIAKALEIRDKGTFIAVLAVDMNPGLPYPKNKSISEDKLKQSLDAHSARFYLLRRCGYACDEKPNIILTRLDGTGVATNDPHVWHGKTWPVAHAYILDHWEELRDGDVIDVNFILNETTAPKISERLGG